MKSYKKPNHIIYFIFRTVCRIISKFKLNLNIKRNELKNVKQSYVIIANHESSIDFMTLAAAVNRRLNFVISNSYYQTIKIKGLLDACGVIPKQQFQTSITDMKKMKEVVEHDRSIAIYPAGLMSENGVSTPIPIATGKFIKWLNRDVYIAYSEGSYLTNPKWSSLKRKGRIDLDIYKLMTKEELENYSAEDVQNIIEEKLYYNAYENQEKLMIKYKNGDNIVGLENVVYQCPKCMHEFTISSVESNKLVCSHCNNTVISDEYGFLYPEGDSLCYKHPSDWHKMISDKLFEEIKNNEDYYLESEADISMIDYKKHKFVNVGSARLKISRNGLEVDGVFSGKDYYNIFSTKKFEILPFKPGQFIELQEDSNIYRVYLKDGRQVVKWMIVLKCFYKINNE